MKYNVLKNGEKVYVGSKSFCELFCALMVQIKPNNEWAVEIEPDQAISDVAFDSIFYDNSIVRCDLKGMYLVLTVPNLEELKEIRTKLKGLGFYWKEQMWRAFYSDERATDEFRDSLIDVLSAIVKETTMNAKQAEFIKDARRLEL